MMVQYEGNWCFTWQGVCLVINWHMYDVTAWLTYMLVRYCIYLDIKSLKSYVLYLFQSLLVYICIIIV